MDSSLLCLTVYFEDPFWIGLTERRDKNGLQAARHVFGEEPSDREVLVFVLRDLSCLMERATVTVEAEPIGERKRNPKRAAREAAHALAARGGSTKAQEALRLQLEVNKRARAVRSREERAAETACKRELSRQKAKERHRGH